MADLMNLHERIRENNEAAARDIEDALARHGSTTEALANRGPVEAVGEAVGEGAGALLNRVGSGGRGEAANDLSRRGGKLLLKTTGRVVDAVGNAVLGGLGLDDPYRLEA